MGGRQLAGSGDFGAAYDCDWPPGIDWETDAAYATAAQRITELETERGLSPPHAGKEQPDRAARGGGSAPPPAADLVVDVPDTSRRQVGAHGRRGSRQSLK
jgi:hypothetical protein